MKLPSTASLTLRRVDSLALASIVFSVMACTSGCEEKASGHGSAPPYDLPLPQADPQGPIYEDPDFILEVGKPQICESKGVLAPPGDFTRLAVPIHLESRSKREIPVGPMLFSLAAGEQTFRPTLASCKPTFTPGKLSQGTSIDAHVAFDVPRDHEELEIRFEPFLVGRKKVQASARVPSAL